MLSLRRAGLALAVIVAATLAGEAQMVFQFEWLGALAGRDSAAYGVNSQGQVTGLFHTSGSISHAFLYFGGQMYDLGIPGGYTNAKANGINDAGQLAATLYLPDNSTHAAFYNGSTFVDLLTLGGKSSTALAINNAGIVVGSSDNAQHQTQAFVWDGVNVNPIQTLGGSSSVANGINSSGVIVGQAQTPSGAIHAFIFDGVSSSDMGTLGGAFSVANGVNDAGQVTGYATTEYGFSRAFLSGSQGLVDLGTLGGKSSYGWAVNNEGLVVGASLVGDSPPTHAFLSLAGGILDLNQLAAAFLSTGSILTTAVAISDNGWIAGTGYSADSQRTEAWRMRVLPSLSGRVTLGSWVGSPNGVPIVIRLQKNGVDVQTIHTVLDAAGNYSVAIANWDTYDIVVKASHWLSRKVEGVSLGQVAALDWNLSYNGDANGDDKVSLLDLSAILSTINTGSGAADLNGDHHVSIPDLAIVLMNYSKVGEG